MRNTGAHATVSAMARKKWSGAKLRDAREALGLTQSALASAMDARRSKSLRTCISRWESDTHPPTAAYLMQLCDVLGVDAGTLYS